MNDEFEKLYDMYVQELTKALDDAFSLWGTLAMSEKYNALGFVYDTVWPAGMGGNPRVLAVIRKYFVEAGIIIERHNLREEDDDGDPQFGVDNDAESENPTTPDDFLFTVLSERDDDLSRKIGMLRFMPIGFQDNSDITEGATYGTH